MWIQNRITQYALLKLTERWKFCLHKQGFAGALLNFYFYFIGDLSKVFDTVNYELLIAKLHAYGFSTDALEVPLSNLQDRWQRVKINAIFSSWTQLLQGVPQGSVFGPILFNIYIINIIFFVLKRTDICNFCTRCNSVRLRSKVKISTRDFRAQV